MKFVSGEGFKPELGDQVEYLGRRWEMVAFGGSCVFLKNVEVEKDATTIKLERLKWDWVRGKRKAVWVVREELPMKMFDVFTCPFKRVKVTVDYCIEHFVESNANNSWKKLGLQKPTDYCFRCPEGQRIRTRFNTN